MICKWVLWCKRHLVSYLSQKVQNLCRSSLTYWKVVEKYPFKSFIFLVVQMENKQQQCSTQFVLTIAYLNTVWNVDEFCNGQHCEYWSKHSRASNRSGKIFHGNPGKVLLFCCRWKSGNLAFRSLLFTRSVVVQRRSVLSYLERDCISSPSSGGHIRSSSVIVRFSNKHSISYRHILMNSPHDTISNVGVCCHVGLPVWPKSGVFLVPRRHLGCC